MSSIGTVGWSSNGGTTEATGVGVVSGLPNAPQDPTDIKPIRGTATIIGSAATANAYTGNLVIGADDLAKKKKYVKCGLVLCSAVCVVCVLLIVWWLLTYNIQVLNMQGWVLYYSMNCPHCRKLKRDMLPFKWYAINKIDCSRHGVECPPQVSVVPSLFNHYTGQVHDGVGMIR